MASASAAILQARPWERFGASSEQWRDWRWQQRHAITTPEGFARLLDLSGEEREGLRLAGGLLRLGATPYYLSLADPIHPACPVRMQVVARAAEAERRPGERADPLDEDRHRPVPAIVHRYPDRVLLLAMGRCSTYCRHCTRRRITGARAASLDGAALDRAVSYVAGHPEVREVVVSGGDPFLLSDERLDALLGRLRAIPHLEILRVGTRMPVCNPMRVGPALARMLRRHAPLFVITHFNHPKEVTADAAGACGRLVDAGVPVENQTVLLRWVNSSARVLEELTRRLLAARVRPYYLHQLDAAEGLDHLRVPLRQGAGLLRRLQADSEGSVPPHFAVDLPGGGGKVTLGPAAFGGGEEADEACPYDAVFFGDS